MTTPVNDDSISKKKRRSDADQSVRSIIDAATRALANDSDVSMAQIARQAGVVRATIYMHFPTRDSLLDAVMDDAIANATADATAAELDKGEPDQALERLLSRTWRKLGQLQTLISINHSRLSTEEFHRRHMPFVSAIAPLIQRGQTQGVFRSDVPIAWHLSMILAIVSASSGEVRSGRIDESKVEAAMLSTVLNAIKSSQ